MRRSICAISALFPLAAAVPAVASDVKLQSLDGAVTFTGSYGLTSIKANELVYDGKIKGSQLIWKSNYVSTLNAAVAVELPQDWYVNATGAIGFGGDGHMADYDWFAPGLPWTDRSLHPDTRLNHYFAASLEVGRTVFSRDGTEIGLGAGFKYTDVKWSAWGGSFVYSFNDFRDTRGNFDPNEKGISYRQYWPVPYIGINVSHNAGDWTFTGGLQAGMAIEAGGIDDHWMRSLRFHDHFKTTPTIALSGAVDYRVWNNASLYLSGGFDRMFRTRADTTITDTLTGETERDPNNAGGDYRSATVSFGLRGRF